MGRRLLSASDPAPAEVVPGAGPFVITVEHGGHAVPAALGDLGLPPGAILDHIGWDPGAAAVARALAARLEATLVVQPYSRLVIDCNRPQGAPDLCAPMSDGVAVPANDGLTEADRLARWAAIHAPFHAAVAAALAARAAPALVSLHSYTPRRRSDAAVRPWPVGLLWRQDNALALHLSARLAAEPAAQPLGLNAPYAIEDASDYTIPLHAEPRHLPHVLIEIRNDLIATAEAAAAWADRLADACSDWRPA